MLTKTTLTVFDNYIPAIQRRTGFVYSENITAYMKSPDSLIDKYQKQLNAVREKPELLEDYRFDPNASSSKHFDRLRLNIALYNDLKPSDYETARFLFAEESKYRRTGNYLDPNEDIDNLYFSALVLTKFENPEIIWAFFDAKNIDMDSACGFDGEYLVAAGITRTYEYLQSIDHAEKQRLLDYIGETVDTSKYTQQEIDDWKGFKAEYHKDFSYPVSDELSFLQLTDEKDLLLIALRDKAKQPGEWTRDEIADFEFYAEYLEAEELQIKGRQLAVANKPTSPSDKVPAGLWNFIKRKLGF